MAESSCSRRVRHRETGDVGGGRWSGGRRCLVGRFGVGSANLKKFQTSWLAKRCLVLLFRRPISLYRCTIYAHSRSNMHAVSVCFRNPPDYDTDDRIFNLPTRSVNAHIDTRVRLQLFCKTEWLPLSWRRWDLGAPFIKSQKQHCILESPYLSGICPVNVL